MEPHSQGGDDSNADLGVDGIKTEIDGLMDSDGESYLEYHIRKLIIQSIK